MKNQEILGEFRDIHYLQERKRRILTSVHQRTTPVPFAAVERRWIDLVCANQQGSDLVPLLYAPGLALEDRLQLLETLMSKFVVDRQLMAVYLHLKGLGQAHHFFAIIEALNQAMPGIKISTQLVNEILRDGRIQSGEATVTEVVTAWSQMWLEFESLESSEERVHLLATNGVLAEAYYRQESERYNFGGQELSFEGFLEIVQLMDSLNGHYEHSAIERYENALEKTHQTTSEEKRKSLGNIEQNDNLDDEDRAFLISLANNSLTPLSEAQILKIRDIGKAAEVRYPEVLLPPNRQRIYRLYFGMAPVRAKGDYAMSRIFVRQFSPREHKGPTFWTDPSLQFRLTYEEVTRLLHTDWSIKETRRLLGEAVGRPYAAEITAELDALLAGQQSQQEFATQAARLHTRLLCEHFDLTRPQATGRIRSGRTEYFNKTILPRLVEAKSHLIASDSMLSSSAHARENVLKRNFDRILPALGHFLAKEAEVTDQKTGIARRLGLPETWKGMTGDKALVEVELIADLAELDTRLREQYLGPLKDVMHRRAEDYKDVTTEKQTLLPISQISLGRYEVRYIDKKDIYAYIRIGDFRPCCISTNGAMFKKNVPWFHKDKMTVVFAIIDPDSKRAVGHMVGHLGLSGTKEEPTYLLNGLYLIHQRRGTEQDQAAFDTLEEFASLAGIDLIRHGINSYHDLSEKPPRSFTSATSQTIRLQSAYQSPNEPVRLYNDLGIDGSKVNNKQETTHYQRRVRATPLDGDEI